VEVAEKGKVPRKCARVKRKKKNWESTMKAGSKPSLMGNKQKTEDTVPKGK